MSMQQAVLEAFNSFPLHMDYINNLIERVNNELIERQLSHVCHFSYHMWDTDETFVDAEEHNDLFWEALHEDNSEVELESEDNIYFEVKDLGDYSVYVNPKNDPPYKVSFGFEDSRPRIEKDFYDKNELVRYNQIIVPFMVSMGKIKKDLPLLMNDWPEFVEYALSYLPEED